MADPFSLSSTPAACNKQEAVEAVIMNLLESELSDTQVSVNGLDIPALCEKLAVLISTGKSKETIGVLLTHEQLKRLTDKEVEKYYKI